MKRILTLVIMLAVICCISTYAAESDTVSVTFKHFSGADIGPQECRVVTSALEIMSEEWYAATQDVIIDRRLSVTGSVNLVLCSGATMWSTAAAFS